MYIPNIPGISTSVVDRSTITKVINNNRTILLPGFFKYGKEGFTTSVGLDEFRYNHGRQDIKKYGIAYLYGELAAKRNRVITYRLLPGDATYANHYINRDMTHDSKTGVTDKDQIFRNGLNIDTNITLSGLATNRGEGYNSIFITFKPAVEMEKIESNKDGETNYKFNFLQAEVYEETINGVESLGDPVIFSLMEVDQITNEPIIDKSNGTSLFINTIFKESNDFATLMLNDVVQDEIEENANIDIITGNNRLIIKDPLQEIYYEIKIANEIEMQPDINGINRPVVIQKIEKVITNKREKNVFTPYLKVNGSVKKLIINSSGDLAAIEDTSILNSDDVRDTIILDGVDAFYDLTVAEDNTLTFIENNTVLRQKLYKSLLQYSMKLYNGFDGENLHINNRLNMYGVSEEGKENAKELLLEFYNNAPDIREVLYPKYDFDYVPDFSEDSRIQSAIINLADDIGTTMPIISCPLLYNPKIVTKDLHKYDIKMRKERLFMSSYNTMLYSGQQNKTHKMDNGLMRYMPTSYYALAAHLRVDNDYSITEPVANIEKGTIDTEVLNLTYAPDSLAIEELRNLQINTIIDEPDGTYIIDQLTMYKKLSKLSRGNVVKVLHRIRKDLPKLLKDLIQKKDTENIMDKAITRCNKNLNKWEVGNDEGTNDGVFRSISVKGMFNEQTYKLRLTVTVNPVGTIESIDIPIIVI